MWLKFTRPCTQALSLTRLRGMIGKAFGTSSLAPALKCDLAGGLHLHLVSASPETMQSLVIEIDNLCGG